MKNPKFNSTDILLGLHSVIQTIQESSGPNYFRSAEGNLIMEQAEIKYSILLEGEGPFVPAFHQWKTLEFDSLIPFSMTLPGIFPEKIGKDIFFYDGKGKIQKKIYKEDICNVDLNAYVVACYFPVFLTKIKCFKYTISDCATVQWELALEEI